MTELPLFRLGEGWEWGALCGAFKCLLGGSGGDGTGLLEVQSGRIRVNGHELLPWKFLC